MTNPILSPLCSICGKPVELEISRTDDEGQAVHEECYAASLTQSPSSQNSSGVFRRLKP
jgi:hypothetical protein